MILYEIEDMNTNEKGLVEFANEAQANEILTQKGFKRLQSGEFYVGHSKENGNELSVMKAFGVHHNFIKEVTH